MFSKQQLRWAVVHCDFILLCLRGMRISFREASLVDSFEGYFEPHNLGAYMLRTIIRW